MSGKGFGKRIYLLEEGNFPLLRPQVDGMALKSESSLGVFSKKRKKGGRRLLLGVSGRSQDESGGVEYNRHSHVFDTEISW